VLRCLCTDITTYTDGIAFSHQSSAPSSIDRLEVCLGAGSVDPFDSLPISTNSEVDYLVRYCRLHSGQLALETKFHNPTDNVTNSSG